MSKQIQLFMLPYAGGNSMSFKKIEPFLAPEIEVLPIEYAGRLTRRNICYIEDYDSFLSDVANEIEKKRNPSLPYVMFGYSLGSVLIYDLLAKHKMSLEPKHVFVCAKGSLITKNHKEDYKEYPEEVFTREIVSLGGIDRKITGNKRFLSIYMEPVREDFIIWGQYIYMPGDIHCDITAIYGEDDEETADVLDWSKLTNKHVDYYEMSGGHFFIHYHWEDTAEIINQKLKSIISEKR